MSKTNSPSYTNRLVRIQGGVVKKLLWPINPYRWNIRRVCRGKVLDVGCGIGRNLRYLGESRNVGVDHNLDSVEICRKSGFRSFIPQDFHQAISDEKFQTLLLSHVVEHLTFDEAHSLLEQYLPYMERAARLVIICPQQRGFASDNTHVTYFDESNLRRLLQDLRCGTVTYRSFPLPRIFGKSFIYNEHVVVVQLSAG